MTKGYWIAPGRYKGPERYKDYVGRRSPPSKKYGATFLRAGQFHRLEGAARTRNVVIEFPAAGGRRTVTIRPNTRLPRPSARKSRCRNGGRRRRLRMVRGASGHASKRADWPYLARRLGYVASNSTIDIQECVSHDLVQPSALVTIFVRIGFAAVMWCARSPNAATASRRCSPSDARGHLQPLGNVGQIFLRSGNLRYRNVVDRAVDGADHVDQLRRRALRKCRNTFEAVQDSGARRSPRRLGRRRHAHPYLGDRRDASSQSSYARTKGRAEAAILETLPAAVILRPSIIFGPEDGFSTSSPKWPDSRRSCRSSARQYQVSAGLRHRRLPRPVAVRRTAKLTGGDDLRTRRAAGGSPSANVSISC